MISSALLILFEISHLVFVFSDVAKHLDGCRGKMVLGRGSVEVEIQSPEVLAHILPHLLLLLVCMRDITPLYECAVAQRRFNGGVSMAGFQWRHFNDDFG